MATTGTAQTHGSAAAPARRGAVSPQEVALRGVHDVSDVAVLSGAIMTGALLDQIGYREGNLAVRGGNLALRGAEHLARNGNTSFIPPSADSEDADLLREEAELTARLEAIRERRSAETR